MTLLSVDIPKRSAIVFRTDPDLSETRKPSLLGDGIPAITAFDLRVGFAFADRPRVGSKVDPISGATNPVRTADTACAV